MLLDVLGKLEEVQVCEAYEIDGERTTDFPAQLEDLARATPVLRSMPGWKADLTGIRKLEDLPAEARDYLDVVAELVGFPVDIVSVGPDREQTILVDRA
jgi:adenylosuccinate synthase